MVKNGRLRLPKVQDWRVEEMLSAIDDLCRSPSVQHYVIGYTKRALLKRYDQYQKFEWEGLAVLCDCLTREEALDLERDLFQAISQNPKTSILYRKYDKGKRDGPYRRSAGGSSDDDADQPIHKVYIAWTHVQGNHD